MGIYNHVDYDWVGVVYPDGAHGTFDQAELDLYDVDKRYTSLKSASTAINAATTRTGGSLLEIIGSWTSGDATSYAFNNNATGQTNPGRKIVINVAPSARWNSVWNSNYYKAITTDRALSPSFGDFTIDGLYIETTYIGAVFGTDVVGIEFKKCFLSLIEGAASAYGIFNYTTHPVTVVNSVISEFSVPISMANNNTGFIYNSTLYSCGNMTSSMVAKNCVMYNPRATITTAPGSLNNATNDSGGTLGDDSLFNIVDPFTNSAGLDFRISNTSPLYEAGTTIVEVTDDIIGVSRPQAQYYDIGAFEYDAGGQTGVPVPINLLNLVIGSRCTVEKVSDGTPIVAPIEATGTSVVDAFAYISDVPVVTKVRLSSPGNPVRYKPYTAPGVITSEGLTVYVDQQVDGVLN